MTDRAGETAKDRRVLEITGTDREAFLQGLVTNDVGRLKQGLTYAALLSPQGKYLADFFLVPYGDRILLDVQADLADGLLRRLMMYRLRADVAIAATDIAVVRGLGPAPDGAFADPRHEALGWRCYGDETGAEPKIDWDAIRVAHCIPETGMELVPDDTYILEAGFERLNGVDFRKGCYVGQEVTARMKHKTELRKRFLTVRIDGSAAAGTDITLRDGRPIGTVFTRSGDRAIAYLRLDRAEGPLAAGPATITLLQQE
ncbi:MAG: folate-binding protein [Albidovulum sp.]|uniref:CAF17-like 4Fe-4S cluster assembly/insertion protein YgfZ n=1 Tax=Albidovulum sp. TaxID=1872424 RepID=UPI003CA0B1AD